MPTAIVPFLSALSLHVPSPRLPSLENLGTDALYIPGKLVALLRSGD